MFLMAYTLCKDGVQTEPHELGARPRDCDTCLEYNNACRTLVQCMYDHEGNLDKDMNMKSGAFRVNHFVHNMPLEEHFVFLKRLEMIVSETHYLYDQKRIKERIPNEGALKSKNTQEFKKALAEQKLAQRPVKERKHLDDRGKAIEAMMRIAMVTEEEATDAVDKQFRKQGKVVA